MNYVYSFNEANSIDLIDASICLIPNSVINVCEIPIWSKSTRKNKHMNKVDIQKGVMNKESFFIVIIFDL